MKSLIVLVASTMAGGAMAAGVTYDIDPNHSYPSFDADHMGGLSVWRGKFTKTSGKVVLDRAAKSGSIDVTVATDSIDYGHEKMNEHARSAELFDVAKFPTATFQGKFSKFAGANPTQATGTFTLKGVSQPLTLNIRQFLCKKNPMSGKEVCGADATASFDRSKFGMDFGKAYGFKMGVNLQIQVEAIRAE